MLLILAGIACFLSGLSLIEVSLTTEGALANKIFGSVCGLILFAGGVLLLYPLVEAIKESFGSKDNAVKDFKEELVVSFEADPDRTSEEHLITKFRNSFAKFCSIHGAHENAEIQEDATQVFWNMLEFQKRRLIRKGVDIAFSAERKNYSGNGVTTHKYFDGKYQVTQVKEEIAATRVYSKDGQKLLRRTNNQAAYYTLLHAKTVSGEKMVCPSCGAHTTKTNLLDGCDYCGTRFAIEDLETRIADFALRDDYEIQYAKYKKFRAKAVLWSILLIGIPTFLIIIYHGLFVWDIGTDAGPIMTFTAFLFAAIITSAIFIFLGLTACFGLVFPAIQALASFAYYGKKKLAEMKARENDDSVAQAKVKKQDELFSISNFYSNVQNKLAAIHYADSTGEVNAFAAVDLSQVLPNYSNVIDMDLASICLDNYELGEKYQAADVRAELKLICQEGSKAKERKENVALRLKKSAQCKTQSVCGPSVLHCKGCGASLSLLEGKSCPHCGREINLINYDWVITGYKIL